MAEHIVLFKERGPGPPVLPSEIDDARDVLRAMRSVLATCTAEDWSGPEDGSLSGHLECSDLVEVSIHEETGGLHLDVCILNDPDVPDRGGMIGTMVDRRQGVEAFMNLGAVDALLLARSTIDGWIAEMDAAIAATSPEVAKLKERVDHAAIAFAAASMSTGSVDGEFMVRIEHDTPHRKGWFCGTDGPDREWTLDERTLAAVSRLLPQASFFRVEAMRPAVLTAEALSWMPEWHGPDDAMGIMRVLAEHGIAHPVEMIRNGG